MGVTQTQLKELIDITLQDLPKVPIEDLLCGVCETKEEVDILINFIKEHYTEEEVLAGLEAYLQRCKWMFELYGKKER